MIQVDWSAAVKLLETRVRSLQFKPQTRIFVIVLVVLLLGIALSTYVYRNGQSVLEVSKPLLRQQLPSLQLISHLQLEVAAQEPILYEYYATVDRETFRRRFDGNEAGIARDIAILAGGLVSEDDLRPIRQYRVKMKQLAEDLDNTLRVYGESSVDWDRARDVLVEVSAAGRQVNADLDVLAASIREAVSIGGRNTRERVETVITAVLAFSVLLAGIAVFVGYLVSAYLREATERHKLAMFVERNPNPVLRLAPSGEVVYANPGALELVSYLQLGDAGIEQVLPEDMTERLQDLLLSGQSSGQFEYTRHGLTVDCTIRYLPEHGIFHCYLADVTERKKAEAGLRQQAFHDSLTGLPNRRYLREAVAELDDSQPAALVLLNFDRFHRLLSNVGPETVDRLLREVAGRLAPIFPARGSQPHLFRFEGDTFVMLAPTEGRDEMAGQAAQRVMETLSPPFYVDGREVFLSASVGVSMFPRDGRQAPELVHNAGMALHAVKQTGGGAYQIYNSDMSAYATARMAMESDLRDALKNEEFFLHFQPQLDLGSANVVAGEALLRWNRTGHGLVSPGQFIPVAEEAGLITAMGDWVLEKSCRSAVEWQKNNFPPVRVAVNISARQFQSPELVGRVREILAQTGLRPDLLELEITESSTMEDVERTVRILEQLKGLGVTLAIDDFGTGFSSMSYLSRFPVDRLKIDQSFVQGLLKHDDRATAIVSAVITLGHTLNLKVIGEGVETEAQLLKLRQLGCDEIQGFLFSRPVPHPEFVGFVQKGRWLTDQNSFGAALLRSVGMRSAADAA
jgi:diguanylate cyclase (GGDEF)-like protein